MQIVGETEVFSQSFDWSAQLGQLHSSLWEWVYFLSLGGLAAESKFEIRTSWPCLTLTIGLQNVIGLWGAVVVTVLYIW